MATTPKPPTEITPTPKGPILIRPTVPTPKAIGRPNRVGCSPPDAIMPGRTQPSSNHKLWSSTAAVTSSVTSTVKVTTRPARTGSVGCSGVSGDRRADNILEGGGDPTKNPTMGLESNNKEGLGPLANPPRRA